MGEITSVIDERRGPRQLHLRKMRLAVSDGTDAGQHGEFDHDVIRIGTLDASDFRLTDDTVSRRHAEIVRTPEGILLRDLGSTNGTFVGQVRIKEVYLGVAQRRFRVGRTEIECTPVDEVFEIVPAEATSFEGVVGRSVAMREVFSVLDRIARTELTVLIMGETGTGKELAARALHQRSRRKSGPFIVFDCGAVPRNLIESELFGHERGAFTGAVAPRAGVFEQAHGGTIFIDELGELPLELQPALLRVLEQREVRRVGDRKVRPVDVRVVAATNRNLTERVAAGEFRSDLYYRLAVVELHLPALRERREDFGILIDHILRTAGFEHHVRSVSPEVERVFQEWHWPGNVRELRNVILRALPFSEGEEITLDALPDALRSTAPTPRAEDVEDEDTASPGASIQVPSTELSLREAKDRLIEAFERQYLVDLLEQCDGNLSKAARIAGVDRKTIARLLKRHELQ